MKHLAMRTEISRGMDNKEIIANGEVVECRNNVYTERHVVWCGYKYLAIINIGLQVLPRYVKIYV
jgi:hypothetical protein